MTTRPEVLALTDGLPTLELSVGQALFPPGDRTRTVAVLVDGRLRIEAGGTALGVVDAPGAFVGEIGALLGTGRTAAVVAEELSTVRVIGEPDVFFAEHPGLALELARQLAGRLHRLTAYLVDVRAQYADSDGHLAMVDSVLGRLSSRAPLDIEPGSDRSPDY